MPKTKHKINDLLITGDQSYATIDKSIGRLVLDPNAHTINWFKWVGVGVLGTGLLFFSIAWLIFQGTGIWGNNTPAAWGFDIINFVWWIGIGHAGTLISAILLLLRQQWRNSINRFSEAMTIFAVMCAGLYPLLHTGRPWNDFWLFPYPNILGMWPQFRSPLLWDVFAVSTYFSVSAVFFFVGLIPDFATLRDRSTNKYGKMIFATLALGWRGSNQHWHRYEQMYLLLAGLSTPLVLSVHSIVSFDFAISIVPGWNVTVFPPYFVAGAVFAGFAMVITWGIPLRKYYKLDHLITDRHMDWMAKILLATGLIVFYGYCLEIFYSYYSGNFYEYKLLINTRFGGYYSAFYWALIVCNGVIPQIFWWNKARTNTLCLFVVCTAVSIGMWLERFVIIPMSLTSNYLPSSDKPYLPSTWDYLMFAGTIGFFCLLMMLFVRFLPMINIFEVKDLLYKMGGKKEFVDGQEPVEVK
ncbi:MAG TPA: NrfD/PsrC family molybdoenzyme membrane anchor subunit [Fimbriimonas sp.]|nr:NrfD/PsrC family molybdoenzyme membrane anchor subunit [Fimbriimonas sp.]